MNQLRLQVYLSRQGVCSRRKAMEYIDQGRVSLNGQVNREPSTPVNPDKDSVEVDGKIVEQKKYEYILLNKPAGYVTTREDRFAEKTVMDLFPKEFKHLNPVGRLDKDTEGLLLLTNDGELNQRLTHPSFEVNKTYEVRIDGLLTPGHKRQLEQGVMVKGKKTSAAKISNERRHDQETDFLLTIHEGLK